MSVVEAVPMPAWVNSPESQNSRDAARLCYLLRLAALHHNSKGSLGLLSKAIGQSESSLTMAIKRSFIAAETAVAIEILLGRSFFPRELFRPDLFTIAGE